jgi:hypothetical protein
LSEVSEIFAASFKSAPDLTRLALSLGWMYVSLGRRVRSARRAFEKELTRTGMSKEDAKRLSATFEELKNNMLGTLKGGVFSALSTRL